MIVGERLDELLSGARTLRAILFIKQNPGVSGRKLTQGLGLSDTSQGIAIAKRLEKFGIAELEDVPSSFPGRDAKSISLTPLGNRLAEALKGAVEVYPDDDEARAREARSVIRGITDDADRARTGRRP